MKKQILISLWAVKMLFKISTIRMVVNILVIAASSVLPVVFAAYTGRALDNIAEQINYGMPIAYIIRPVLILGILFLLNIFLYYGSGIITSALDVKVNTQLNGKILGIVENIPLKEFDDAEVYNDFTMAQEGFASILSVTDSLFQAVGNLAAVFSTMVVILATFPPFAVLTIISFAIGYRLNMASKKEQRDFWKETVSERRFANYLKKIMTSREYAREVRSYNAFPMLFSQWKDKRAELRDKAYSIAKTSGCRFAMYQIFMEVVNILVLIISIFLAYRKQITLGEIVILWKLSDTALISVQTLNSSWAEIFYNNEKLEKAKSFLEKNGVFKIHTEDKKTCKVSKYTEVFRMDKVSFAYKNGGNVLEDVSLSVYKNQAVAIIGENGSGKSTLAKLLAGLYKPDSGDVYINGYNSKKMEESGIKHVIGIAFQDFVNYPFTLRENIGYGYVDKLYDDNEIRMAAEKGDASYLVDKAGELSRVLGKTLDKNGMEMSGGEWQRIALSRAYMGDKPILVFDEPASKLDPNAELRQFERIREMIADKTALLISHRIGFARLAQRIIVMKDGKIVEDGTHEELLMLKGEYYRMLSEQAKWYDLEWEKTGNDK